MGAFSDGFRKWVRGMNGVKTGDTNAQAAAEKLVRDGFDEMIAAPIADEADRHAEEILRAFDK